MGSAFNKDSNIDIYLNTYRQFYIAGETVEGQIYINAKAYRLYNKLVLKLEGNQYFSWSQSSGQNTTYDQKKHLNYSSEILIKDLGGHIEQGQYVYPFSFLLPNSMSGSFYDSSNLFIKYILRAQLTHSNPKDSQSYEMFLNIIQPPRNPLTQVMVSSGTQSKCCNCCINYGIVVINMKSNKNFVVTGDNIQISGTIDNSRGKQTIKESKLILEEWIYQATYEPRYQFYKKYERNLHTINQSIYSGSVHNFNFSCSIPQDIHSYTAIGSIVSRYFILHLYTSYGCCAKTAQAKLHIILHSRTPKVVEKKNIPPPSNWNPQIQPKFQFYNMPPFIYKQNPQIPFYNLPLNQNEQIQSNSSLKNKDLNFNINSSYQPVYYNQNMFNQHQRQQQGYQPYFQNYGQ